MALDTRPPAEPLGPGDPGTQMPDWELPPDGEKRRSRLSVLEIPAAPLSLPTTSQKWRTKLSDLRRRRWNNMSKRSWIIIGCVIATIILALAIGLGVGLTRGKNGHGSKDQNLPLPGNAVAHVGDLTYYGVGLGACGINSEASQNIVAVSHTLFDAAQTGSDPNANPLCGQKIRARRYYAEIGEERSVDLTVVDRCVGCQPTDLDVSTGAFDQLAPEPSGRVDVTWAWLGPAATAR